MNQKDILIDYFHQIAPLMEGEREKVQKVIARGNYRAKDYMLFQGDVCNNLFYITKGLVRYAMNDKEGNDISLVFRAENEFVTDYESFLSNEPSKRFIEVIEDVECLKITNVGLQSLYNDTVNGDRVGRKISEALFLETLRRLELFYNSTPEERYLYLLEKNGNYLNRIPQAYIASHIGVRPQSLSRIKKRFLGQSS